MSQIVPSEPLAGLHGVTEVHDVLVALAHLVIHIVGDEHVERLVLADLAAQHGHDLFERFRADPIVRVHDLHVHAARRRDAGVDRAAGTRPACRGLGFGLFRAAFGAEMRKNEFF